MTAQQRKALTFYAALKSYQSYVSVGKIGPAVMLDEGKLARAALRSRRRADKDDDLPCSCEAEEDRQALRDAAAILRDHAAQPAPSSVAEEAPDYKRIVESIAAMLGWLNVPPQRMLEADISALKARAKDPTPATTPGTCSTCMFWKHRKNRQRVSGESCTNHDAPAITFMNAVSPQAWGCILYAPKPSPDHPVEEPSR